MELFFRKKSTENTFRNFLKTRIFTTVRKIFPGWVQKNQPLVTVFHCPKRFTRRSGELTVNICGLAFSVQNTRYKLNQSQWHQLLPQGKPRVPSPFFTIELRQEELQSGINELTIEAINSKSDRPEITSLQFEYDPNPIELPIKIDWSNNSDLEVQDGYWETFEVDGSWRVRPKPGFEGYDRILNLTGAFPEGRRIETDVIFRQTGWLGLRGKGTYGFGILSMWGGHHDDLRVYPRRGWNFGIAWFSGPPHNPPGKVVEFSYKYGDDNALWSTNYQPLELKANVRYFIISECFPELDAASNHLGYRQRMKWWMEGDPEPKQWLEITDVIKDTNGQKQLLQPGEYAVALLAHNTQVDFGSVTITPLQTLRVK
jgi:hypothetical protein